MTPQPPFLSATQDLSILKFWVHKNYMNYKLQNLPK